MTWKAKVFRWGNPGHHPLHAETQIPSFAWAGDRVCMGGSPTSLAEEGHIPTPHAQLAMARVWAGTPSNLRAGSKPTHLGSGHEDGCPGMSCFQQRHSTASKNKWLHREPMAIITCWGDELNWKKCYQKVIHQTSRAVYRVTFSQQQCFKF